MAETANDRPPTSSRVLHNAEQLEQAISAPNEGKTQVLVMGTGAIPKEHMRHVLMAYKLGGFETSSFFNESYQSDLDFGEAMQPLLSDSMKQWAQKVC